MTVGVYIDSCAWNYFYENGVDLLTELPPDHYSIHITREVEIELDAIPDIGCDESDKAGLKTYIRESISTHPVGTSYVFGFATHEPDGSLSKHQVYGGFNVGAFQSTEEADFYAVPKIRAQLCSGKKTKSGLGKNEADASLAAKSLNSIVLTNERANKEGPLKLASELGGRIVRLDADVRSSGLTLGNYLSRLVKCKLTPPECEC